MDRLTRDEAAVALALARGNAGRPVGWCLIDTPRLETLGLADRLTACWGPGVVWFDRLGRPGADAGLPSAEAATLQRRCRVRVWPGGPQLDFARVRAAAAHGCLPLQVVGPADAAVLAADLPAGLQAFVLAVPAGDPLPGFDALAIDRRLDDGLSVLLAGSREQDMARTGRAA